MADTKSRVFLFDNGKFFLITAVVIGHFADIFTDSSDICKSIFLLLYSFHMPLFLFISGLYHNNKNILKKCLFYISTAFFSKILISLAKGKTENGYTFSLLSDFDVPWYLFVLSFYIALCFILRNENKIFILGFCIVLACFTGYDNTIGDYLYISRTIVFFPFYLSGTMIKPELFLKLKKCKALISISVIILFIWVFLCFEHLDLVYILRALFTGRNAFYGPLLNNGILLRILTYAISSLVGFSIIILLPAKRLPFISQSGTKTLNVYLWHLPIFLLLNRYLEFLSLFSMGYFGKILYLFCGILLTFLISYCKIFDYPQNSFKNAIYKNK